jgi:hypothetical protein
MVPIILMFCAAQGLPRWSEPGKYEAWTLRPYRRTPVPSLVGRSFDTDQPLLLALDWLTRNQADDGSWEAEEGESRVGVTGVALLAYLGAGFSTWAQQDCPGRSSRSGASPPYRGPPSSHHLAVRKAIGFLVRAQGAGGVIGTSLRDHAIAAYALTEACASSGLRSLVEVAERAMQVLEIGGEASVFGWTALAVRSAAIYGIPYPRSLIDRLAATAPFQPGALEVFRWSVRRDIPRKEAVREYPSIRPLVDHLPVWKAGEIDPPGWYWGTLALYRYDGPEGPGSRPWNKALKEALLKNQDSGGSWSPPGRTRTASTAFFALTLTPHYQFRTVGLW